MTATGTRVGNIHGEAIASTVITTLKWSGRFLLPVLFRISRRPALTMSLREHAPLFFARWTLIRRLPDNGQFKQRLRFAHLIFETTFNGGWEEFFDRFSYLIPRGMSAFYGSSYGFPDPLPAAPFKAFIAKHEYEAGHFYCAYAEVTTREVAAALALARDVEPLLRKWSELSPTQFEAAWRAFLNDAQHHL